jgi:hypothetical protein
MTSVSLFFTGQLFVCRPFFTFFQEKEKNGVVVVDGFWIL